MLKRSASLLAVTALMLAGCGQKGALYLPEKGGTVVSPAAPSAPPATAQPAPATAPAPAATPPAKKTDPDDGSQPPQ